MRKFYLPEFDTSKFGKIYAGNRSRWATATAVCFVDSNRIIVASFLNKRIYLIQLDTLVILNEISTPYYVDLMDYKEGLILTSNRHEHESIGSVSIFHLENNTLHFEKNLLYEELKQLHGCRIINKNEGVVTCTMDGDKRGLFWINLTTGSILNEFRFFEYYPKDVYLLEDKFLVVTSNSKPDPNKVIETDSYLYLFDYEFNLIDKLNFFGQTDCITFTKDQGFITLQAQDMLLRFGIENNKVQNLGLIEGFNFPHGITSFEDKVVVTNYGDNSILIFENNSL